MTDELRKIQSRIEVWAREYGLDFFETIFELVDYRRMNAVAAYGGFPIRYPHWRFGMEFERLFKSHTYGLSTIYELVINNDPAYAYLMNGNPLIVQKMVMAHVLAHVDFFKNNAFFEPTNRRMIDEMANHAVRIERYMDEYGVERVESFVDTCLSLENLIDIHRPYRRAIETQAAKEDDVIESPQAATRTYLQSYLRSMDRPAEEGPAD